MEKRKKSSWEPVSGWYHAIVGEEGHYYHREVIFPKLLSKWKFDEKSRFLDLGCGQGVAALQLPDSVEYCGVDISPSLIQSAKSHCKNPNRSFITADACKPLSLKEKNFTHALILLAFQNFPKPLEALKNIANHLVKGGSLALVINHPCFRIPRQSSWGVDEPRKLQYRRVDRYMTPMEIPIEAHPGKKEAAAKTLSFHHPLHQISAWLKQAGFLIEEIEEWCSNKESSGSKARMENRARDEFPLFMTLHCLKK